MDDLTHQRWNGHMETIPPEHKLPCDFICGHIRFRKGVALETVRQAAERWLLKASAADPSPSAMPEPPAPSE